MCIDAINSGSAISFGCSIHVHVGDSFRGARNHHGSIIVARLSRMRSMAHSQQLRSDGPNPIVDVQFVHHLIRRQAANHITSPFHVFKGSKAGPIGARVLTHFDCPPWMHIQVQQYGSYRAEDMIDLLEATLHTANNPE